MNTKIYMLENLGCAHCAAKMEEAIKKMTEVVNENTKMITVFSTQLEVLLKAIAIKYSDDEEIGREVKEYEIRRSQSKVNGSV